MDLAQYLFAEHMVSDAFDRAEKCTAKTATYDAYSFSYKAQDFCYRLKFIFTFGAAIGLVIQVMFALLH